jgi:DNA-binding NarL/FixJ family response regulator
MIPPTRPWTLFVVDDHPVIGAGFELATLKSPMFNWVGAAPNLPAAASRLDQLEPDVLILDLVIEKEIGVFSISECRIAWPNTHVVIFSSMPATHYAHACIAEGALLYCEKSNSPPEVLSQIAGALSGKDVRRPSISTPATRLETAPLLPYGLTPREADLLIFFARGQSAQEIAQHFGKSIKTISAQRDTIRRKLGCRSTREMTALLSRLLAEKL